jgi:hypothetical protein
MLLVPQSLDSSLSDENVYCSGMVQRCSCCKGGLAMHNDVMAKRRRSTAIHTLTSLNHYMVVRHDCWLDDRKMKCIYVSCPQSLV